MLSQKYQRYLPYLLFLSIGFLLFFHLNTRTFHLWDEARLGINAAEMVINGNYFYTTYQSSPDFWNTKPHLLVLLQAFSLKLFGFNEASVRLPSACASLFTCLLIYYWVRREKYSIFYAALATMAFITTRFLVAHGARAGDYESLLIFYEVAYCFGIFQFIKTNKIVFLWLFFIALTLAVLTKGVAGILFVPGIAIFILLKNKIKIFLSNPAFYLGSLFFLCTIAGYYYLHDQWTPGYLQAIYQNEIGGRFFNVNEGHQGGITYYLNAFKIREFYFVPIWLIGLAYALTRKALWKQHLFLQYIAILSLSFFAILTYSKTKIGWYAFPLYPFLGISVAIFSEYLASQLNSHWRIKWINLLKVWMVLAYFAAIIAMLASNREKLDSTSFLKNNFNVAIPHSYKLVVDDLAKYDGSLDFQIARYYFHTQQRITKTTIKDIHTGDWIIINKAEIATFPFNLKILNTDNKVFGIYEVGFAK